MGALALSLSLFPVWGLQQKLAFFVCLEIYCHMELGPCP